MEATLFNLLKYPLRATRKHALKHALCQDTFAEGRNLFGLMGYEARATSLDVVSLCRRTALLA